MHICGDGTHRDRPASKLHSCSQCKDEVGVHSHASFASETIVRCKINLDMAAVVDIETFNLANGIIPTNSNCPHE